MNCDWDLKNNGENFKVVLKEGIINNNWSSPCEIETIKKPEIINYSCNDLIYFKGKRKEENKYLKIIYK